MQVAGKELFGDRPLSRAATFAWLAFYLLFLAYAAVHNGQFLFIDMANLVIHEGGHLLFGWFGPTLGLWGGTILQWAVPLALAIYFFTQRQTAGFIFCLFFFFENWLYTATYMADARAQVLPLVSAGGGDYVEHDWFAIFSGLGVLRYDTLVAAIVRVLGWCGMLGSMGLLIVWDWYNSQSPMQNRGQECPPHTITPSPRAAAHKSP
jgi:hypothetical protein